MNLSELVEWYIGKVHFVKFKKLSEIEVCWTKTFCNFYFSPAFTPKLASALISCIKCKSSKIFFAQLQQNQFSVTGAFIQIG